LAQKLRDYQVESLDQIIAHFNKGEKKVLLHLDTGAGKTTVFAEVLKRAYNKGNHALMVVRGRKLVDQAHKRLLREQVPHGVIMAGHRANFPDQRIQICSIDTLTARKIYPKANLIVYDEAHLATSASYKTFVEQYPSAYHLPVTATPYLDKSLRHIANTIVRPINMKQLIEKKYLVNARYFAPSSVNLKGVKTTKTALGNDYSTPDLEKVLSTGQIVGDLVENYKKYSQSRKTLIFAVSVKHSLMICEQFREAGINILHVDASTPERERESAIAKLESGEISAITNCGILTTGVDIPSLGCILLARPTKSICLYLQILGRGTRPFQDKQDFIVIDCVGNVKEHGFITDEREADLDGKRRKSNKIKIKTCYKCKGVFEPPTYICPYCGFDNSIKQPKPRIEPESRDGELVEVLETDKTFRAFSEAEGLIRIQNSRPLKPGWVWHQLKKKYGEKIATEVYKKIKPRLRVRTANKNTSGDV